MKVFKAGEKSRAICSDCKKTVRTTFTCRDVSCNDGSGIARDILVAVCDECGNLASIPPQSRFIGPLLDSVVR
jgi:RNase P subunit RPR2